MTVTIKATPAVIPMLPSYNIWVNMRLSCHWGLFKSQGFHVLYVNPQFLQWGTVDAEFKVLSTGNPELKK